MILVRLHYNFVQSFGIFQESILKYSRSFLEGAIIAGFQDCEWWQTGVLVGTDISWKRT